MPTYLITGANTGIGRVTAEALAAQGGRVFLACRSLDRTQPVLDAIKAKGGFAAFLPLDLGDLESVRACAKQFLDTNEPLDVLINNAGLMGQQALTKSGFEPAFGTNHVGHFLLTKLLLPHIEKSPVARIVNVSSKIHYQADGIDFEAIKEPARTTTGLPEYRVSKLANVLFTRSLAKKLPAHVTAYSLHPGVVASNFWRNVPWGIRHIAKLFMISSEDGARTTLYCATDPAVKDQTGLYYDDCKSRLPSPQALDDKLAEELWTHSEQWCASFSAPL